MNNVRNHFHSRLTPVSVKLSGQCTFLQEISRFPRSVTQSKSTAVLLDEREGTAVDDDDEIVEAVSTPRQTDDSVSCSQQNLDDHSQIEEEEYEIEDFDD